MSSLVRELPPFRLPDAPERGDLVARYFRALSDPTRLRILELVQHEELSVGELVERTGAAQPQISNHLACLRWCGFVASRREGRAVLNSVADKRVVQLLELAKALLEDNAEHVASCCEIATGPAAVNTSMSAPLIEILGFDGCPNIEPTRALIERIASELGLEPVLEIVDVPDSEAAVNLRFLGSPTVRVNGIDIEPGTDARTDYVFACRVYRTAEGISGRPSEAWLRDALGGSAATAAENGA